MLSLFFLCSRNFLANLANLLFLFSGSSPKRLLPPTTTPLLLLTAPVVVVVDLEPSEWKLPPLEDVGREGATLAALPAVAVATVAVVVVVEVVGDSAFFFGAGTWNPLLLLSSPPLGLRLCDVVAVAASDKERGSSLAVGPGRFSRRTSSIDLLRGKARAGGGVAWCAAGCTVIGVLASGAGSSRISATDELPAPP